MNKGNRRKSFRLCPIPFPLPNGMLRTAAVSPLKHLKNRRMKPTKNWKRNGFSFIVCLTLFPVMAFAADPGACASGGSPSAFDADGDGTVTAEELSTGSAAQVSAGVAELLAKYDADGDGTVTTKEAESVFAFISADWIEDTLGYFDTDGDGAITTADYTKVPKSLKPLLREADTDADGALSATELQAAAATQTADRLARFLFKYDTDDDGTVTTAEITAIYQGQADAQIEALLSKYDTDGDGVISAAEIETAQSARGHRGDKR